jgi:hypothetical protein
MARELSDQNTTHRTIPTVSPRERSLIVTVEDSVFASFPNILPPEDTRYGDFDRQIFAGDYRKQFENYLYKEQLENGRNGAAQLLFVKTRTDEERMTPVKERIEDVPGIEWPNVLEWVVFAQDDGFPLSQNTINSQGDPSTVIIGRAVILYSWLPGMSLTTRVRTRIFVSEYPWPDWAVWSDEPKPTEVSFDFANKDGGFPKCLHDDITVEGTSSASYRVVSAAGDVEPANKTANNSQFFPKTNHKRWQEYVVNETKEENGLFIRYERTYYPPNRPKLSQRQQ